jgi:hypothetical protein
MLVLLALTSSLVLGTIGDTTRRVGLCYYLLSREDREEESNSCRLVAVPSALRLWYLYEHHCSILNLGEE